MVSLTSPAEQAGETRHEHRPPRHRLLRVAIGLLAGEGPQALSVRRVAAEAGCPTSVVYTTFGSREGLAEALYLEGFDGLRRRMEAVPAHPDPCAHLLELGRAYREYAIAEPLYYSIMFEKVIPGFAPSERARAVAGTSLHIIERAVARCVATGGTRPADPTRIAEALWAAAHGAISLELSGHLTGPATHDTVTTAVAHHYLDPPPAHPE
ncbi:TetR/AcrR family transcriptional regulator [Bailinhaonella thermotolerans]|nr:TetR/AcrR family transcriptional regulator [Bailinhaonella thermotolerans]